MLEAQRPWPPGLAGNRVALRPEIFIPTDCEPLGVPLYRQAVTPVTQTTT
jgi:hypothetical protein